MVVSSVHAYKIDDLELPVYPTSATAQSNLVSKAWNDMWGKFHSIPINYKNNIVWTFDSIDASSLITIHNYVINKIKTSKENKFTINCYLSGQGWVSGSCYLGFPIKSPSEGYSTDGSIPYSKYELYWTEIDGTVINSPGA